MLPGYSAPNQSTTNPGAVPLFQLPLGTNYLQQSILRPSAFRPPPQRAAPRYYERSKNNRTQEVDLRALGAACNIPVDFINYLRKFISESRILACFNSYISLKKSPEPLIDAARAKSTVPLRFIIHLIQEWGDDGRHLFGGYEHYVQMKQNMEETLQAIATAPQCQFDFCGRRMVPNPIQPSAILAAGTVDTERAEENVGQPPSVEIIRDDGSQHTAEEAAAIEELPGAQNDTDAVVPGDETPPLREAAPVAYEAEEMIEAQDGRELVPDEREPPAEGTPAEETTEARDETVAIPDGGTPVADKAIPETEPAEESTEVQAPVKTQKDTIPEDDSTTSSSPAEILPPVVADGEDSVVREDAPPPPPAPVQTLAPLSIITLNDSEKISITVPVSFFRDGRGTVCVHVNQCEDVARRGAYASPSSTHSSSSSSSRISSSQGSSKRSAAQMEQGTVIDPESKQAHPMKTQRMWNWDGQSSVVQVVDSDVIERATNNQVGPGTVENVRRESHDFMQARHFLSSHYSHFRSGSFLAPRCRVQLTERKEYDICLLRNM